jgi:hypothetical protein
MTDIIMNTDGEVVFGFVTFSSSKIRFTIGGVNSFEESPYRPVDDNRFGRKVSPFFNSVFMQRGQNVIIEGLTGASRFLRSIEYGDGPNSIRQ